LFVGGCGRVFEGTFPMMQASLAKLAVLPGDTAVYCTHEYTLANLAFAQKVDPHNEKLATHLAECEGKRAHGLPTVPSTIQNELEINPFLRWNASAIIAQLKQQGRHRGDSPADVFGAVRGWKDEG
jgi:hydroxyacylglutathione hydrolase